VTLEQALTEALNRLRNARTARPPIPDDPIDAWLVDTLAESQPCGFEAPTVHPAEGDDGVPLIHIPDYSGPTSPDDARAIARMLLVAADQCDALPDEIG
jgi:hypothetical protein